MTETTKFHKPNFDSRQDFTKFLVDLKEMLVKAQVNNYKDWLYALRTIKSHYMGLVNPDHLEKWQEKYDKIKKEVDINSQNKNLSTYNPENDLFKLQEELNEISAPLYLPTGEEDDDNEDW